MRMILDVANFGDERTVVTLDSGELTSKYWKLDRYLSIDNTIEAAMNIARNHGVQEITVNTVGIGMVVFNRLRILYPSVYVRPIQLFSKRA
jgi:hypothetical protein